MQPNLVKISKIEEPMRLAYSDSKKRDKTAPSNSHIIPVTTSDSASMLSKGLRKHSPHSSKKKKK